MKLQTETCDHYALINVYSVIGIRVGYECFDCEEILEMGEDS